jgi:AcrR family transcriptional regulator
VRKTEQRERVLALLAEHLLQTGLAKTSLRQLAAAAEVSDRMLIYYFGSKAEVLSATTELLAARIVAFIRRPGASRLMKRSPRP